MSNATRSSSSSNGVAEAGRLLLEGMHISESSNASTTGASQGKRLTKRQLSNNTYESANVQPAAFQRVNFLGARKPGVVPRMWTAAEDEALRAAVAKYGEKSWRQIAEDIPHRNHLQCLQRWKKALRPGLVKGQWTKDEDAKLLGLIQSYLEKGTISNVNWAAIAQQIEGRNAKQCRERWFLNLDPSINRGPWTDEENRRLMELAAQCGGRWSLIAKNMPGRTENMVKTRYHSLQRQEARNRGWTADEDNTIIQGSLVFGRDWGKITKQLPGRSRGQVKKRFTVLTQNRSDIVRQVQSVEEQISAGRIVPPNPPPAPIKPIGPHAINAPQPFSAAALGPPGPGPAALGARQAPPTQHNMHGMDTFASVPPPPMHAAAGAPRQKGMFRKYGSSWMAGIAENLDAATPASLDNMGGPTLRRTNSQKVLSQIFKESGNNGTAPLPPAVPNTASPPPLPSTSFGGEPPRTMQRQDTNALLDKFLADTSGSTMGLSNSLAMMGGEAPPVPASAGGEAPAPPAGGDRQKGLRNYNSWGSLGGGDIGGLFGGLEAGVSGAGAGAGAGAPSIMRTGSGKGLKKMGSSNWPALATHESTDLKNFINML